MITVKVPSSARTARTAASGSKCGLLRPSPYRCARTLALPSPSAFSSPSSFSSSLISSSCMTGALVARMHVDFRRPVFCLAMQGSDSGANAWIEEKALYIKREEALMAELAASRAQMGKVLDMQQTLIDLVASLSTSNTSSVLGQVAREAKPLSTPVYSPPPASSSSQANSAPLTPLPNIPLGASLSDVLLSLGAAVQPPSTPSSASNAVRDAMAMVSSSSSADDADADLLALLAMSVPTDGSTNNSSSTASSTNSSSSSTASSSGFGAVAAKTEPVTGGDGGGETYGGPTEFQKAAVLGKPPDMMYGDDDIYWMNHVHASLLHYGFYVDDQEVENWIFGDATTEAVMYFQSTHSLAETGIVDEETWEALFKDLPDTKKLIMDDIESGEVPNTTVNFPGAAPLVAPTATPKPTPMRSQNAVPSNFPSSRSTAPSSQGAGGSETLTKWPILREGDGGKAVHLMQLKLSEQGFSCSEDEMRWWMFESKSYDALRTFQACNQLPESGVCDERTWRKLVGDGALPHELDALISLARAAVGGDEDSFSEDISWEERSGLQDQDARVWLLGEQRWSIE